MHQISIEAITMGNTQDRISDLPDTVLESILHLVPIKCATRTKNLSRRWRSLWWTIRNFSTALDFGKEFASNQAPDDFVAAVNRYLQLDNSKRVLRFSLFFFLTDRFKSDIENWIAFAIRKQVEELDLDFSQGFDPLAFDFTNGGRSLCLPDLLFCCESLRFLSLNHCDFGPAPDLSRLHQLQSISLAYVNITQDTLDSMLANCPMLETLILKTCLSLSTIRVMDKNLKLKRLVVVECFEADEVEIFAPRLESFVYYGECNFKNDFCYEDGSSSFVDISSLKDAFICSIGLEHTEPDHDYIKVLCDLAQVKILTVCTATLMCVTIWEEYYNTELKWPIVLPNLKELQLLMDGMNSEYLGYMYGFFRLLCFPELEKLFVQLPSTPEDPNQGSREIEFPEETLDVTFQKLKVIKLSSFKGSESEMRLARFLLKRAVVLETLVLVTPQKFEADYRERIDLAMLHGQLSSSPMASPEAKTTIYNYSDDDKLLCPTHTEYYCEL